jgi:2-amino-4-hydroxy-6-hydroxymethyldihydropteridine diphosphokinase
MSIVYLALGSNLGDRQANLKKAVDALNAAGIRVKKVSTIIETEPVNAPPPKYLNAVLKTETVLSPEGLHDVTRSIEHIMGRVRDEYAPINAPRIIDIDILLYDDIKLVSRTLLIPHPRMFEREFVMKPLKEIAPDLCE